MKIKIWGARGSIAISNADSIKAGGNTTCYEVMSSCLPPATHLILDTGTGFVPAGWHYLNEISQGLHFALLFTHWHWDHILGLTLSPPTFIDNIPMSLYGPVDNGIGPKEMIQHVFRRPFFPVDYQRVCHKMNFHPLENFDVTIIVSHPEGGFQQHQFDHYMTFTQKNQPIPINGKEYNLSECLIITMQATNHGNATCISYRFHEMPTNKVFIFCTDHEDQVSVPLDFKRHLANADLAIMDAQYDLPRYTQKTGGFGHGTPTGIIKQGLIANIKKIGLTHHDPGSTDIFLEDIIMQEAKQAMTQLRENAEFTDLFKVDKTLLTKQDDVFLCYDYAEIEV